MITRSASDKLPKGMKKDNDDATNLNRAAKRENGVPVLIEGVDYYLEEGLMVFTAHFLKQRGYCCENDCRHCPYEKGQSRLQ